MIWNALRKLLSHHRSFPDAEWALPRQRLAPLAEVFERLTPSEAVAIYGWLFSDNPDLAEGGKQDWTEQEKSVAAARLHAVRRCMPVLDYRECSHYLNGSRARFGSESRSALARSLSPTRA